MGSAKREKEQLLGKRNWKTSKEKETIEPLQWLKKESCVVPGSSRCRIPQYYGKATLRNQQSSQRIQISHRWFLTAKVGRTMLDLRKSRPKLCFQMMLQVMILVIETLACEGFQGLSLKSSSKLCEELRNQGIFCQDPLAQRNWFTWYDFCECGDAWVSSWHNEVVNSFRRVSWDNDVANGFKAFLCASGVRSENFWCMGKPGDIFLFEFFSIFHG